MRASDGDDRPARARFNVLAGSVLLVVGVVLLAGRWNVVAGVVFTFFGVVMVLAGRLFSWSNRDRRGR